MKELKMEEMMSVEGGSPSRPQDDGMPKNTRPTKVNNHNHPSDSTKCFYCNPSPHLA